ncbi:MAG: hypothetical protein ACRC4N_15885, partial [Gammaproteobacteria bacterium]
ETRSFCSYITFFFLFYSEKHVSKQLQECIPRKKNIENLAGIAVNKHPRTNSYKTTIDLQHIANIWSVSLRYTQSASVNGLDLFLQHDTNGPKKP